MLKEAQDIFRPAGAVVEDGEVGEHGGGAGGLPGNVPGGFVSGAGGLREGIGQDGLGFGAAAAGCGTYFAGAGNSVSATAIGNVSQIQVQGSWNTVVASVNQTNSGPVTATVASK